MITSFRTVVRKSSKGGFTFVQGGLTFRYDKNSTYLKCFIFQFGGFGAYLGGLSPPKFPVATGLTSLLDCFDILYSLHKRVRTAVMVLMDNL